MADYIVVETACEEYRVVNDHLTAHCPYAQQPPVKPVTLHVALPLRGVMRALVREERRAVWIPQR